MRYYAVIPMALLDDRPVLEGWLKWRGYQLRRLVARDAIYDNWVIVEVSS